LRAAAMQGRIVIQLVRIGVVEDLTAALTREIARRGVRVAVVRRAEGEALGPVDSCLNAGASATALITDTRAYVSARLRSTDPARVVEDLGIREPLVLVEGFEPVKGYPKVAYVAGREGVEELARLGLLDECVAIVAGEPVEGVAVPGGRLYAMGKIGDLAGAVIEYAASRLASQLPGENCGLCGFGLCRDFAMAILRGERAVGDCPVRAEVELKVDGRRIPLSAYPRSVLIGILKGYLATLKGVPERPREVEVKIKI